MDLTQPSYREQTLPFIFLTGLLFLMMPVLSFMVSCLGFIIGIPVTSFHLPAMLAIDIALVYAGARHFFGHAVFKPMLWSVLLFSAISIPGAWHLNRIFDNSFDGVWYHQEAVINLAKGWNPYYRALEPEEGAINGPFYDNHYPKAAWIAESVVYRFTGKLESSKVVNLWMALGLLFTSLFTLLHIRQVTPLAAVLLSVLLGFNPVSIYQLYTFYIDGQLGAALMALIILLAASLLLKKQFLFLAAVLVFVYAFNLKFTGAVYGSIIMIFYLVWVVWKNRPAFFRQLAGVAIAAFCALLIWGYPTYVTNTLKNKHPLYPIMGPGAQGEEIAAIPRPANFAGKNRFEKFYIGTFAAPVWCRAPLETQPKKLFRPVPDRYYFTRADFEISGFGPFYAENFLFMLLALGLVIFLPVPGKAAWLFAILAVTVSSFTNSEVWYARYVPHFWLIGIILIVALYQYTRTRHAATVLLAGLLLNSIKLALCYFPPHIADSRYAHEQIMLLKKLNRPVHIFESWQVTFRVKAAEYGLPFVPPPAGFDKADYKDFQGFNTGWGMYNIAELEEAQKLP